MSKRLLNESKKDEEKRILAEMDAEMKKKEAETGVKPTDGTPAHKMACPRCKGLMENGVCGTCGHKVYIPMDEKKRNKIRLIVGIVCVVAFVAIFVWLQFKKG